MPHPSPASRLAVSSAAASAVLALALALAGCTSGPAPDATPTAPAPSASATPPPTGPSPLVDAACGELVTADELRAAFGETMVESEVSPSLLRPMRFYSLRQLYGSGCSWTNGQQPWIDADTGEQVSDQDFTGFGDRNPGYREFGFDLLPSPGENWQLMMDTYYADTDSAGTPVCGVDEPLSCMVDRLTDSDVWVSGTAERPLSADAYRVLAEAAVDRVATAPVHAPDWKAPADPLSVRGCEGIAPLPGVADALGVAELTQYDPRGGGWSQFASADALSGVGYCSWFPPSGDEGSGLGSMEWLPGGAWALDDWVERRQPTAVEIDGLLPNDAAWLDCESGADYRTGGCVLDLRIASSWVRVSVYPAGPDGGAEVTELEHGRALALGTVIADAMR